MSLLNLTPISRQVVREQCWLNETLKSCSWAPEGLESTQDVAEEDEADTTEADLQAILNGQFLTMLKTQNWSLKRNSRNIRDAQDPSERLHPLPEPNRSPLRLQQ